MHLLPGVQNQPPQPLALGAGSWAHVSPFCLALLPVWAAPEESRRGLPSSCFEIPPLCKLPRATCWAGQPARVTAQLMGRRARDIGPLESPLSGSLKMGAPHTRLAMGCGGSLQLWLHYLTAVFSCLAGLVLLLRPGDSLRKSVECSVHCGQPGHLQIGAFIGSGPGSLWLRGVRGDGYTLS